MSQLIRPLRHCPRLHHLPTLAITNLVTSPLSTTIRHPPSQQSSAASISTTALRNTRQRARGLRLPNSPAPLQDAYNNSNESSDANDAKKSRNQLKRDARRSVKWAMDLASFSNPQIKRILKAVALEDDVFDAILLLKRLGPDVREGKRRQINYIGKLLREVQPELMDGLIHATKDGDHSMLRALSASASLDIGDDDEEEEEFEDDTEEEDSVPEYFGIAGRWFEGLISKDIQITNEVYSVRTVDFDRQELRRLVRDVHAMQECEATDECAERKINVKVDKAKKSLTRFLRSLAEKHTKSVI